MLWVSFFGIVGLIIPIICNVMDHWESQNTCTFVSFPLSVLSIL